MKRLNISKTRAAGACAVTAAMLILTALAAAGDSTNIKYLPIALLLGASRL